jgi:hypothetical protein
MGEKTRESQGQGRGTDRPINSGKLKRHMEDVMRTARRFGCMLIAMLGVAVIFSCAGQSGSVGGEKPTPAAPAAPAPPPAKAAADPNMLLGTWRGAWQYTAQSFTGSCDVVLVVERINGDTADVNYTTTDICGGSANGKAKIFSSENMAGLVVEAQTRATFLLREDGKLQGTGTAFYRVTLSSWVIMEKSK